ncbi:MAG: CRISPR-associated protein Cas5 [Candidatus Aenigmatarchaeota archaeon]
MNNLQLSQSRLKKTSWIKLILHFPSFFSYRIPDYSSQYALGLPLPSPSVLKLATVATAIRVTGKVSEGKKVFNIIKNADIKIRPPSRILINSFLIKRLKGKKDEKGLQRTFGTREYILFSDDIEVFIGGDNLENLKDYFLMMKHLGSSDSLVYTRSIDVEKPPKDAIEPLDIEKFEEFHEEDSPCLIFPVKDIKEDVKFEEINPFKRYNKKIFEQKYYFIPAKIVVGKGWKILKFRISPRWGD